MDRCPTCDRPLRVGEWPFCPHGFGTTSVIGDECDFVSHNGETQPVRFRSKQEHRRWLKQHGYRIKDDHVGQQGSDKSPFSSRSAAITQKTLDDARIMLERGARTTTDDVPRGPGITSFDGLTRYLKDQRHV